MTTETILEETDQAIDSYIFHIQTKIVKKVFQIFQKPRYFFFFHLFYFSKLVLICIVSCLSSNRRRWFDRVTKIFLGKYLQKVWKKPHRKATFSVVIDNILLTKANCLEQNNAG